MSIRALSTVSIDRNYIQMTMNFEENVVMCVLVLLFSKKAKKEDVGLPFNQPETAFRPVSFGFVLKNVRIS